MKKRRAQWIAGGKQGPLAFIPATPDETYLKGAGYGTMDPKERLKKMDEEGLDKSVLFPTLGLNWEAETRDPEYADACCRAYNRWIADFCRDSGGRLVPAAHISLGDPALAARELERAVKDGCKIAFISPYTITRKPHGHPDHDVVFAAAQDLGMPLAVHPNFEPKEFSIHTRFLPMRGAAGGLVRRHVHQPGPDHGLRHDVRLRGVGQVSAHEVRDPGVGFGMDRMVA